MWNKMPFITFWNHTLRIYIYIFIVHIKKCPIILEQPSKSNTLIHSYFSLSQRISLCEHDIIHLLRPFLYYFSTESFEKRIELSYGVKRLPLLSILRFTVTLPRLTRGFVLHNTIIITFFPSSSECTLPKSLLPLHPSHNSNLKISVCREPLERV